MGLAVAPLLHSWVQSYQELLSEVSMYMQAVAELPKREESSSAKPPFGPLSGKPSLGSRAGSLGRTPNLGKSPSIAARTSLATTKYSGVSCIDRDTLRAGLARSVLETAEGRVNGNAAGEDTELGILDRQTLQGTGQRSSSIGAPHISYNSLL